MGVRLLQSDDDGDPAMAAAAAALNTLRRHSNVRVFLSVLTRSGRFALASHCHLCSAAVRARRKSAVARDMQRLRQQQHPQRRLRLCRALRRLAASHWPRQMLAVRQRPLLR
jgi:hypothetical protein